MTSKVSGWTRFAIIIGIVIFAIYSFIEYQCYRVSLASRLEKIVKIGTAPEISCGEIAAKHPLVLLALGQSNAGNHGTKAGRIAEPITLIADGKCIKATEPLPGGTGAGSSIWQRLPALIANQQGLPPVVISVLAVDATAINDWTRAGPLKTRLIRHIKAMRNLSMAPSLILWQQGEADALIGTSEADYIIQLNNLAEILNDAGSKAPIILARSTICQSTPSLAIRSAIQATVSSDSRFRLGPDTDLLSNDTARSGCHLTEEGLDRAARMWSMTVMSEASSIRLAQ